VLALLAAVYVLGSRVVRLEASLGQLELEQLSFPDSRLASGI
jgi:hypothetical protein